MSKEKEDLYKIIVTKNNRPDHLAIELYLDIERFSKEEKRSIVQIGYSYFTEKYKYSQRTIARKFVVLENLGLIKRSFTTETLPSGYRLTNILNLSLLERGKNE
jgi:hypothetical protein